MIEFIPEDFGEPVGGRRGISPAARQEETSGSCAEENAACRVPAGEDLAWGSFSAKDSATEPFTGAFSPAEKAAGTSAADEIRRARQKAMDLLLDMDRTENGLRQKLEKKGFSEEAVDAAVSYVKSYGYVDDVRYADHYIAVHRTLRSRRRIRYDLGQKGLDRAVIDDAFEKAGFWDERPLVRKLAEKKAGKYDLSEPKSCMKLAAYLSRQGFASSDIRAVIADMRKVTDR